MEHDTQADLVGEQPAENLDAQPAENLDAQPAASAPEMPLYRGTKNLLARPMTRGEYTTYRGWTLPADENGDDEGYLVEYLDGGGKANHQAHRGYISWSPKEVFERAYHRVVETTSTADEADTDFILKVFGVNPAKYHVVEPGGNRYLDRSLLAYELEAYRPLFASRVAHGRYA